VSTVLFWIVITIGALSGGSGLAGRGSGRRKGPVDPPVGEDRLG
jgi:hypothetical protein